jgi:hypothetical protein
MKIRVSLSHIMISSLLSSWSYSLINFAFIDRFLFIDRFSQLSWKSRYSRNLRIKLFSNRERFAKPYSAYSISSALTLIQLKKPSSFNPAEKAVLIQLSWKSRLHSTHLKKSSPFNSAEKAVLIQSIWKSRPHLTQLKKPSPFNPAGKAVLIQLSCKSRSHLTQLKKPSPFNPA